MSDLDNYVSTNHYTHCGVKWKKDNTIASHEDECPNCLRPVKADSSLLLDEDGPLVAFHSDMIVMAIPDDGVLASAMDITVDGLNALTTLYRNEEGVVIKGNQFVHADFAAAFNAYSKANGYSEVAGYVVVRADHKGRIEFLQGDHPTLYHTDYVASSLISNQDNSGAPYSVYRAELVVYRPTDHRIHFVEGACIASKVLDTTF